LNYNLSKHHVHMVVTFVMFRAQSLAQASSLVDIDPS
jgi:hypothetical protein